jgi:hypothetical protein
MAHGSKTERKKQMPRRQETALPPGQRLGRAGWTAVAVLAASLAAAAWYAIHAWSALDGVPMSPLGWLFLTLGAVFTLLVGGGLMALVFYSSRHNLDR